MRRPSAALGALALGLLLSSCAVLEVARLNARDLTEFEVRGTRLYMAHEVNARSLDQFLSVTAQNPGVKTLVLTVVPGSVDDEINLALGRKVRELGLNTHLVSGGMIASGGVDLFLAGVERTMEKGAFVGVHTWSSGIATQGERLARDDPEHQPYLSYFAAIGTPESFYWFTLEAAPAKGMHWMTSAELERFGVLSEPLTEPSGEATPFDDVLAQEALERADEVDPPSPVG